MALLFVASKLAQKFQARELLQNRHTFVETPSHSQGNIPLLKLNNEYETDYPSFDR